jgi:hypothetical protein
LTAASRINAISTGAAGALVAGDVAAVVAEGAGVGAGAGLAVAAVVCVGAGAAFASPQIAPLILSKIPISVLPFRLPEQYLTLALI